MNPGENQNHHEPSALRGAVEFIHDKLKHAATSAKWVAGAAALAVTVALTPSSTLGASTNSTDGRAEVAENWAPDFAGAQAELDKISKKMTGPLAATITATYIKPAQALLEKWDANWARDVLTKMYNAKTVLTSAWLTPGDVIPAGNLITRPKVNPAPNTPPAVWVAPTPQPTPTPTASTDQSSLGTPPASVDGSASQWAATADSTETESKPKTAGTEAAVKSEKKWLSQFPLLPEQDIPTKAKKLLKGFNLWDVHAIVSEQKFTGAGFKHNLVDSLQPGKAYRIIMLSDGKYQAANSSKWPAFIRSQSDGGEAVWAFFKSEGGVAPNIDFQDVTLEEWWSLELSGDILKDAKDATPPKSFKATFLIAPLIVPWTK